ncbi:hypothetical protein CHLNCDRAFT_139124 [Chlorella variabilis]|uniref:Uncharacterized protein n=1 Tax=Chlorella variabilis TaxID=554065 RepID=E1ZPH8_CHLVA|nr:hypothetical protein CHLNCDRAFT_139124 [Chlorella variabilis]EFN52325.1 hypothetical protein CHLNCDRAFT_139124 [Chlorella variabilis]|eukprot:XP_005844427.1 hypothetical protein CHLNCDRAFT_139124 [Chlorella variabilis]
MPPAAAEHPETMQGSQAATGGAGKGAAGSLPVRDGAQQRRRRAPAATLPELRSRAAFRACDRLMEQGAGSEAQLWTVARVMCGEEYEQARGRFLAAEERAIAGKCGNPLCSRPPRGQQDGGSGRHRSSTSQAVLGQDSADDMPLYCGADCEAAVRRFAARLGSGALALERFTAMYQLVRQGQQQRQQEQQAAAAALPDAQAAPSPPAAETTAAAAAEAAPGASAGGLGSIWGSADLVPRLEVEQVHKVKHIGSSAGQFGDFSRKPKPRATAADGVAPPPKPKGVLKKQSQFAAGTAKVPIMLAEVKEREPSIVAAETARGLQPGRGGSSKAAAAVEGYVPRAGSTPRQRQRRVRFTDDTEASEAAAKGERKENAKEGGRQTAAAGGAGSPANATAADSASANGGSGSGSNAGCSDADSASQPPAAAAGGASSSAAGSAALPASGGSSPGPQTQASPGSVLVFEVEQNAKSTLGQGSKGLAAQFGRLYVADAAQLPAAVAPPQPQPRAAAAAAGPSPPRPLPNHNTSSTSIDIQQRGLGNSSGGASAAVPREWREVPQFYAHSPVGSSSSLAGSFASPGSSSGNLAAMAAASPPQAHMPRRRLSSPPPGLPRAPSSRLSSQPAQQQQQPPSTPDRDQPRGREASLDGSSSLQAGQAPEQEQAAPTAQQAGLTKRQAEQLQHAFPQLSAALPPELQAALASDSETDSEAADSEGWMESEEEAGARWGCGAALALGWVLCSSDEAESPGARSGFRLQLSFFGTFFTHLEAWVTSSTAELLASGPDAELALPPPTSPEVLAALSRCLSAALPPVCAGLQAAAARGQVERSLDELLRTLRLVGPLPAFKASQWQVVAVLFLKALSLERCPALREAFETRDGITRLNRLLASLSFTSEEFYAILELLCPVE